MRHGLIAFFDRRILLGDLQFTRFGIHVTHFFIFKRRVRLPVFERGAVAPVDGAQYPDFRVVGAHVRYVQKVDGRLCTEVDRQAARVAQVGGAQDRQHQVGAAWQAIEAESLAKVFGLAWYAHFRGRIPQAGDADGGVEQQPGGDVQRALALELQQAVEQVGDVAQVVEEVADAFAQEFWGDVGVAMHHRQEHPLVEAVVEV